MVIISGVRLKGKQRSFQGGRAVVGATLTSFDDRGKSRTLKIEDVQIDPEDTAQEIYLYTVLSQRADGQWQNLCLPDSQGVAKAIPLSGRWDATGTHIDDGNITFACINGALGKCVRWGYKPWQTIQGESLRDYHQACTRMVRADYCGNGMSHTQEGTPIDVYDRLGIQHQTSGSGMVFEAAWGVNGMVTLNRPRMPGTMAQLQQHCPKKLALAMQQANPLTPSQSSVFHPLLLNDSLE